MNHYAEGDRRFFPRFQQEPITDELEKSEWTPVPFDEGRKAAIVAGTTFIGNRLKWGIFALLVSNLLLLDANQRNVETMRHMAAIADYYRGLANAPSCEREDVVYK